MTIWKLGCNWGSGAPSFYEFIKQEGIVISDKSHPFKKGDLILIAEGHQARAIAEVLDQMKEVTTNPTFKEGFIDNAIEYEDFVFYSPAKWVELAENDRFEYKLQQGICKINNLETREKILATWPETSSQQINTSAQFTMTKKTFLNQILYGPPGTGKTYHTINNALEIAGVKTDGMSRSEMKEAFDKKVEEGQIVFTTFHQSMSYEDFIEGIKPIEPKEEGDQIIYRVTDGIFKELSKKADNRKGNFLTIIEEFKREVSEADNKPPATVKTTGTTFDVKYKGGTVFYIKPHNSIKEDAWYPVSIPNIEQYFNTNSTEGLYNITYVKGILEFLVKNRNLKRGEKTVGKHHILIIDEINRGNVSQIFGELITLIEEDKRLGNAESLEVMLPYSKEKFGVPPNLYIIGTMNTADRSVEALDTALRRRFSFVEMPPDYDLEELNYEVASNIKASELLKTINTRIEKLLDKDHLIGHSYLMKENGKEVDLRGAFYNKIIPLLQEYFYGDYGKVGLVLGKGFVRIKDNGNDNANLFCDFDYDTQGLDGHRIYEIIDYRATSKNNDADMTFKNAIQLLMKQPIA